MIKRFVVISTSEKVVQSAAYGTGSPGFQSGYGSLLFDFKVVCIFSRVFAANSGFSSSSSSSMSSSTSELSSGVADAFLSGLARGLSSSISTTSFLIPLVAALSLPFLFPAAISFLFGLVSDASFDTVDSWPFRRGRFKTGSSSSSSSCSSFGFFDSSDAAASLLESFKASSLIRFLESASN